MTKAKGTKACNLPTTFRCSERLLHVALMATDKLIRVQTLRQAVKGYKIKHNDVQDTKLPMLNKYGKCR